MGKDCFKDCIKKLFLIALLIDFLCKIEEFELTWNSITIFGQVRIS